MYIRKKYSYLPDCTAVRNHTALFSIPEAVARWCGVKEEDLNKFLQEMKHTGKGIYKHDAVPCVLYKSQAIYNAIEEKQLFPTREYGGKTHPDDHVAYERRHFYGKDLKEWISRTFPEDKPPFLFTELERTRYEGFTINDYQTLLAENTNLKQERDHSLGRIEKAIKAYTELKNENKKLKQELDAKTEARPRNLSRQLQLAVEAHNKFWANADLNEPDTCPIKDDVIRWAMEEKGLSKTAAERIAEVIRPEGAPVGRPAEQ